MRNHRPAALALLLCACTSPLAGCGKTGNATAATPTPAPATATASSPAPVPTVAGPDILTTTGSMDSETPTDVRGRFGHFQIAKVDGVDTLLVDGKSATYVEEAFPGMEQPAPGPIAANVTLTLVGVFELARESVAWVVIGGGTACAGTHLLVPVGETREVRGLPLKGCDDRGTMRKIGDRIVFEAGGESGAYDHGRIVPA